MRKIVFALIIAVVVCSCKHDYTPPPDFNFSLEFGYFNSKVSTFDSTLATVSGFRDTIVKVIFTKEEMKQIYQKMVENDYLDLPDTFRLEAAHIPCGIYYLTVYAGSRKKVIFSVDPPYKTNKSFAKFDTIAEGIIHILYSKKEIKNLPPSRVMAL